MRTFFSFDQIKIANTDTGTHALFFQSGKCVYVHRVSEELLIAPDQAIDLTGFVGFSPIVQQRAETSKIAVPSVKPKPGKKKPLKDLA